MLQSAKLPELRHKLQFFWASECQTSFTSCNVYILT
jgi:hypothetical protein